MTDAVLTQYTIYSGHRDFPLGFIVKEWHMPSSGGHPEPGRSWHAKSLDGARRSIPLGAMRVARSVNDDPSIVETWT